MAQQKITIPVQFIDSGDSANKIAKNLANAVGKSNLSAGVKEQTEKVVGMLQSFAAKSAKFKAGELVNKKSFAPIYNEGQKAAAAFSNLIKQMTKEAHSMGLSEEVIQQLNEINTAVDKSRATIKAKQKENVKQQRLESPVTSGGKPIQGFGNYKDIDIVSAKIVNFRARLEELRNSTEILTEKEENELRLMESQLPAITQAEREIQKRRLAIETNNNAIEEENKIIEQNSQLMINLQGTSTGTIMDPKQLAKITKEQRTLEDQLDETTREMNRQNKEAEDSKASAKGLSKFASDIKASIAGLFGAAAIFNTLKRAMRESVAAVKSLDKSFNDIAIVTTYTTKEAWKMKDAFIGIAQSTGLTTAEVAKLSVEFFRQGRSLSETLKLTEAAGTAAKIANISTADSVNYLTSAINGYKLSASQAMMVSDKFSSLAASSATDYEELAIALSKVAAQAYSAGVDMDNMMGFIAKALEVTREAPENIGTAFKTIFARMSEIKDYGKTLEDGMDVNRVDKALKVIGVDLTDQNHELRNLDEVLMEVGGKWKGLDKNQKAYIATALAGTRQQTRLISVFENFDRTVELAKISSDSLGASYAQQAKYYDSIEYAITKLTTAWQNFISSIVSSDLVILVVNALEGLVRVINGVANSPLGGLAAIILGIAGATTLWAGAQAWANELLEKSNKSIMSLTVKQLQTYLKTMGEQIFLLGVYIQDITIAILNNMGLALSENAVSISADRASVSIYGLKMSLDTATFGIAALITVTIALVAWFGKLAYDGYKAHGTLSNLAKTSKSLAADLYNVNKKGQDISGFLNAYEKLDKKINKTTEDITQMQELAQKIQDITGEVQVLDLEGNLDTKKVKDFLEENTEDINEAFKKGYKNVVEGMKQHSDWTYKDLDAASQSFLSLGKAAEIAGQKINNGVNKNVALTRAEFLKLDKETQDYYSRLAKAALTATTTKVVATSTPMMAGRTYKVVPTLAPEDVARLNEQLSELTFNEWSSGDALSKYNQLLKMGYDTMKDEEKLYVDAVLEGSDTIYKITQRYGELGISILDNMGGNLNLVDDLLTKIESFNLGETVNNRIVGDIITKGGTGAFNDFIKSSDAAGLSIKNVIELANTFNEIEFGDLDTKGAVEGLKSMQTTLQSVSDMLGGKSEFDITALKDAVNTYPEIAKYIKANSSLSAEGIKEAMKLEDEAAINELENENISYGNQIKILQSQYDMYAKMQGDELYLASLTAEEAGKLAGQGLQAMLADYKIFVDTKNNYEIRQGAITTKALQLQKDDPTLSLKAATEKAQAIIGMTSMQMELTEKSFANGAKSSKEVIDLAMGNIQTQIDQYRALITINETAISKIKNKTLANTKDLKESTEAAKEYIAKLTEIYALEQKIAMIQAKIAEYRAIADNPANGQEYVDAITSINEALQLEILATQELVAAQKASQTAIFNTMTKTMQGAVQIINGRMIPVMSKYNKLSSDDKEIVDEKVESYNSLADAINEGTISLKDLQKEYEDNIRGLKEQAIDMQKQILEAILASEEKKYEAIKKGIEAEKTLLDKRKAMYDKAFAEEDYANSLEETSTKREDIIKQLAALEGATDLASNKKREELLQQKADLDKEYNISVRDYNREALSGSLDDQQTALDQQLAAEEEAYQQRIANIEALEARVVEIMNGGIDNIILYMKENLPAYSEAFSAEKDLMVEDWTNLGEIAIAVMDGIEDGFPSFDQFLADIAAAQAALNALNSTPTSTSGLKNTLIIDPPPGETPAERDARLRREAKSSIDIWNKNVALLKTAVQEQDSDAYKKYSNILDNLAKNPYIAGYGINSNKKGWEKYKTAYTNTTTSGCPDPLTPIMVSPLSSIIAGKLKVGDKVYTMHETTKEFGYFKITHAEIHMQPKLKFIFTDGSDIIVSNSHRFYMGGDIWRFADSLQVGENLVGINTIKSIKEIKEIELGAVVKFEIEDAHTYISAGIISHNVKTAYATGGLATSTGLAWLDGTPSEPERVLNPIQTELFEKMVKTLEMKNQQGSSLALSEGITIGQITITTPQLNTNLDFNTAGQTLGNAFKEAIAQRGLNINKKR